MSNFPETTPQIVSTTLTLALAGTQATEMPLMFTKKLGTVTDVWGMTDVDAAADGDLAVSVLLRGTAYSGTKVVGLLNGAGTAWVGTTVKTATVTYNTDIAAESYLSAVVTRAVGSTATAYVLSVGLAFVPGSPAAVGAIDT